MNIQDTRNIEGTKIMKLRDHPGVVSKGDFFRVDPSALKVDPRYNVRDLTTPESVAYISELADSIAENGVRVPLEIRLDGEDLIVVSGHCRLAATKLAIERGCEIKLIPAKAEPPGINDADRDLSLIIHNSGKPLSPLEIADVVFRLSQHGWEESVIARKCGWKSVQTVKNYLDMRAMPADAKDMVKAGEVSATLAAKVTKQKGSKAAETLKAARADATERGKNKVTQKAVTRVSKPSTPPLKGQADTYLDFVAVAEKAQSLARSNHGILSNEDALAILGGLCATYGKVRGNGAEAPVVTVAAAPQEAPRLPPHIKRLLDLMRPFAEFDDLNQVSECSDDDMVTFPAKHIKAIAAAYRQAMGVEA
jgi:ParB-like chromosome segregation protein Spo0J